MVLKEDGVSEDIEFGCESAHLMNAPSSVVASSSSPLILRMARLRGGQSAKVGEIGDIRWPT